jgi:hypothetical protein
MKVIGQILISVSPIFILLGVCQIAVRLPVGFMQQTELDTPVMDLCVEQ